MKRFFDIITEGKNRTNISNGIAIIALGDKIVNESKIIAEAIVKGIITPTQKISAVYEVDETTYNMIKS